MGTLIHTHLFKRQVHNRVQFLLMSKGVIASINNYLVKDRLEIYANFSIGYLTVRITAVLYNIFSRRSIF